MSSTAVEVLKRDGLGAVELLTGARGQCVRRVACGCRWPGSRLLARLLLAREQRALAALRGVPGVPLLLGDDARAWQRPDGRAERGATLLRSFLPGVPLHAARALPADFFVLLERLVGDLHARGVCHNDLHKENNIVVGPDGRPALIDFQLASVHRRRGARFAARCSEDLRHVAKHRCRYERQGRLGPGDLPPRPRRVRMWARLIKPLWRRLRRLGTGRDDEPRRPRGGPWPQWTPPVGSSG